MNIEQIKSEASEYVFKINTPSHSRSDFAIYLHQYIDYIHSRGYLGGVPDGYVLVPKCTQDKLHIAEKALAEIAVYDLFDCSSVEDTDFQEQAKTVYKIAENAIKEMIKIGGDKQNVL